MLPGYTIWPIVRQNLASCHQRKFPNRTDCKRFPVSPVHTILMTILSLWSTLDSNLKGKLLLILSQVKTLTQSTLLQIYKFIKCWLPAHLTTTVPQLFFVDPKGIEPSTISLQGSSASLGTCKPIN